MSALSGSALAIELVNLTAQRWVVPQMVGSLAEKFEVRELQAQIRFLTGVKTILRELPVKIFSDMEARQALLDAAQQALDAVIDQEEEDDE